MLMLKIMAINGLWVPCYDISDQMAEILLVGTLVSVHI